MILRTERIFRLSNIGYRVGSRLIELLPLRDSLPPSTSRGNAGPPRLTRLLPVLQYIHTTLFKYLFGRPASSLERSTEAEDEYMVGDDEPVLDRGIQVPRDMSQLNTNALLAGIVEAAMEGLGFVSPTPPHTTDSAESLYSPRVSQRILYRLNSIRGVRCC